LQRNFFMYVLPSRLSTAMNFIYYDFIVNIYIQLDWEQELE
jgi:hypothetical protein